MLLPFFAPMTPRTKLLLCGLMLVLTGAVYSLWPRRPAAPTPETLPATTPAPAAVLTSPPAPPPAVAKPASPANPAVMAATERMYLAHASLRTPEVADPDSASNRQILQTMVEKALSSGASGPAKPN
jgi:hypothetical protein